MFSKAKTTAKKAAPAGKKDKRVEIPVDGLEQFAQIDALIKALTTVKASLGMQLKETQSEYFKKVGDKTQTRPENFRGLDGDAKAMFELRKRSSRSPLSDDEVAKLTKAKIEFGTVDTAEEMFIINPEYADDSKMLEKVGAAIAKVKGVPEDFIMFREGETKNVVTDATINQVFGKKKAKDLLDIVGVFAIKPTLDTTDMAAVIDNIKTVFED